MARFKVWGEWQNYQDAETHDNVRESMLETLAKEHAIRHDGFPDSNDCDKATIYMLDMSKVPDGAEDDENFRATDLAEKCIVTLRISYSYTTKRARR